MVDLSALSIPELTQLEKDVQAEIVRRKDTERSRALQDLQQLAADRGFTISELLGQEQPKKAKKLIVVRPQYRNPDDANQTWTGRGRKPQWVLRWEAKGGTLDQVRIS
ncbi:H-NS histone family protein [Parachitinimonas caeni]|uniref:H-NS histone family protein n=1 Tax=Parachitinimonas caeni TaxID=3031301 RepID=A0ABT7DVF9_9NEIS|nr:H-NS histone family protein [Parachitinimonas caeni]MDK2123083.1 H-NS histone family protein [Parachitinimonas caeni]